MFGINGLSIAISQGHYGQLDSVSQVACNNNWFITAGRDSQICVFDAEKCLGIQKATIKVPKDSTEYYIIAAFC